MRRSRSVMLGLLAWIWLGSGAAAQGVASVLMRESLVSNVPGSFAGEMTLVTDTLRFRVEAGTIRNESGARAVVESVSLALGEVGPDGGWRIVHRGYAFPVEAGLPPGERLELDELFLGLIVPSLLQYTELHPMVVITLSAPGSARPAGALLEETLGELFGDTRR